MQPSLLIIIFLAIIILIIYGLKKYNVRVIQTLIKDADVFLDDIIKSKRLKPISTHINLKNGEVAFLQTNSVLKEKRNVRYYQSGHAGLRVMKGFYIGKTSGKSESQEEFKSIDMGTLILTNKRIVFDGSSNSRNILLSKLIAVNSFRNSISVSSESRQKNMTFTVKNPLIWELTIKLLSFVKNPLKLTDTEIENINGENNSISKQKLELQQNSELHQSQSTIENPSTINTNLYINYHSKIQAKYRVKRDNLFFKFKYGYNFLKFTENNKKDIWIGTSTNAHLYLRNNYLAYIVINDDSLSFRARYNNQIYSATIDKSQEMFSNNFRNLILSLDGFNKGWVFQVDEFYTFTNTTPNDFFLALINYITKLKFK